jgi:ATP-dependent Clp protease ATP-binding subunit ClpA
MFTSNLGAETLLTQIETSARPSTAEEIEAKCRQHLIDNRVLPELTGRIQAFALYYPLSHQSRAAAMAIAMQRIASSYGLELQFVEPKVIADFIIADQNNYLGVRPDEYLIDRKLGILFADARKQGIRQIHISHNPLRVVPPPQDPTPSVHQSCVSKGTMQAPNENEDTTLPLQ